MNTVIEIERILSRGSKQTTYKLAVLRALVDFIVEHPGREPRNGWHHVPVIELARRALTYYWRLALEGIPQGHGSGNVIIPRLVRALADAAPPWPGIDFKDPAAGWQLGELIQRKPMPPPVLDALLRARDVLLDQPLRYLPNVGGGRVRFFSVVTLAGPEGTPRPSDPTEAHLNAASSRSAFRGASWPELLATESTFVILSSRSFEEIEAVRYWLLDSIKLRWALECRRFGDASNVISVSSFELTPPARDPVLMDAFRDAYRSIGLTRDVYTGEPLPRAWHLDHVLPWSTFPVNLFWNLVPTAAAENLDKSARLPPLTDDFRGRYLEFTQLCLDSGNPLVLEDERDTYRRYFQATGPTDPSTELRSMTLLGLVEQCHERLAAAGVDTWERG